MSPASIRGLVLLGTLCLAMPGVAQEFRQFNRIPTAGVAEQLPPGAHSLAKARPVPAAMVEEAVNAIAAAWNTPRLEPLLASNFYDKFRLLDTLNASAPRHAVLRVLSIQGRKVLLQYSQRDSDGTQAIYSRVAVTVRTQVEYTDSKGVFQRLDGSNELILQFREPQT